MNGFLLLTGALLREKRDIILAIIGGFVAGLAGVSLFSASGYLISRTVFLPPLHTLIVLTSFVKILGLLRAASRYGERLYSHRATFSLLSRLRVTFFQKLAPLAPGVFNKKRSGDLLARIVGDVEGMQHYFLRVLYPPIVLALVFLATVVFAAFYSIGIACLFVVGMLAVSVVLPAIVRHGLRGASGKVRAQRAELSAELGEWFYGFRDLKVYGQLKSKTNQLSLTAAKLTAKQLTAGRRLLLGQALHAFVALLLVWSVLLLGSLLIGNGSLDGVFLAMLVMAALTVFDEAAPLAVLPAYKQDSEAAAQRLTEITRESESLPPQPTLKLESRGGVSIDLRGVSQRFDAESRPALRDIQLVLPAGSRTAIVGASGSGKSTILDLLVKFYLPAQGEVLLNGIPTADLEDESIWRAANVVLQRNHFFRGTIRDNLLTDGQTSDERLTDVLEGMALPHLALDDEVLEQGENLSDGEKQRLALARAMLHGGRLWLLDEPTSSLDALTERAVMERLLAEARQDTIVLISHRLAGLEHMDQIVVLDRGTVVESGTYTELMERRGAFYALRQMEEQLIGSA